MSDLQQISFNPWVLLCATVTVAFPPSLGCKRSTAMGLPTILLVRLQGLFASCLDVVSVLTRFSFEGGAGDKSVFISNQKFSHCEWDEIHQHLFRA